MSEQDKTWRDRYVTNAELKDEIDKLPTRWEVRFLILAAIIASSVLPTADLAHAAAKAIVP